MLVVPLNTHLSRLLMTGEGVISPCGSSTRIPLQLHRQSAVGASVIDPTPNRRPKRAVLSARERRRIRARVDWRKPGYVAWLYFMNCEDRPDQVKVGLSVDPVRRAFGVRRKRKRGAVLPIVEYGKQVSNAVELERKTHELLKRYRVRREWFRCSVLTATAAILRVAAAAGESGPSKVRDEWIEEQAQALVIIWRHDWYIPTAMRPRVDHLREEAKKKAREEAEKAGENLYWLTIPL
jgi:T5orf172 domain